MKRVGIYVKMSGSMRRLIVEAYIYLAWARILKWMPFSRIAPALGTEMAETTKDQCPERRRTLSDISQAIHLSSKYTFWESECLVKAIAAMKMMEKRKIESTMYLGTAKDKEGKLIAHAWVRSGPYYITGNEGIEQYTVVRKFARNVRP